MSRQPSGGDGRVLEKPCDVCDGAGRTLVDHPAGEIDIPRADLDVDPHETKNLADDAAYTVTLGAPPVTINQTKQITRQLFAPPAGTAAGCAFCALPFRPR